MQDEQSLRLEGEVLAEALQRYLPYLEALSQAAAPRTLPGPKLDRPLLQVTLRAFSGLGWARTWGFSGYLPYPGPGEGARTHGLDPNLAVWLRGPLRGTRQGGGGHSVSHVLLLRPPWRGHCRLRSWDTPLASLGVCWPWGSSLCTEASLDSKRMERSSLQKQVEIS